MSILPELRRILVDWMLHHRDRPSMYVDTAHRGGSDPPRRPADRECWSIEEILYALWDDPAPVPAGVSRQLDLQAMMSFGELARTVHDARVEVGPANASVPTGLEDPWPARPARPGRATPHRSRPATSQAPGPVRWRARS